MPKLIITRGLPGSGKTTKAKAWVAEDPIHRVRVNRDLLRIMLHGGQYIEPSLDTEGTEKTVQRVRNAIIAHQLKWGSSVICDDTNLPQRVARDLRRLADSHSAEFEVWDLTDVPVEVCIERDAQRTGSAHVGEGVIRRMALMIKGRPHPLPLPDESELHDKIDIVPYVPPIGNVPEVILVDIDGTVALMCNRSPYDETRVCDDRPNVSVIQMVHRLHSTGVGVIFCSGRTDACREATEKWLAEHVSIEYQALHMRKAGDMRKDSVVKMEIFDQHIRLQRVRVVGVFDDRNQVVEMWRTLGLTVYQVADGNF